MHGDVKFATPRGLVIKLHKQFIIETKQCVNLPGSYTCQDRIEINPFITLSSRQRSMQSPTAHNEPKGDAKKRQRLNDLIERMVMNPGARCATKNVQLTEIVRTERNRG